MELFYAELHEKPVALIFLIRNKKADILDYLAVDPTIRGHRIGSRILTWLQEVRKHPFIVGFEGTRPFEFYESILADYFGNDLIRYVSKGDASN